MLVQLIYPQLARTIICTYNQVIMKVLLIASECAPLVKVGGIADVIGSLPLALSTIGVDARIVIPYYKPLLDAVNFKPIKTFLVNFAGIDEAVSVHETKLSNS